MARHLRIEFSGALYHVTTRGNAKSVIFLDDGDKKRFFRILGSVIDECKWQCHAYCLMENHFHLLVETLLPNLSAGMRQLNGQYTQAFNRRHNRVGHLFQGRFHSVLVEKDSHLLELSRYIVLNPVRAGIVSRAEDWRWSSYLPTCARSPRPSFLTTTFLLDQFSDEQRSPEDAYADFVSDGIGKEVWQDLRGGILLSSDAFARKVDGYFKRKKSETEFPRCERVATRMDLGEILSQDQRSLTDLVREANRIHGYKQREIAEYLGISQSKVSQLAQGKARA